MHPKNRKALAARVHSAAYHALVAQSFVRPLDVLLGLGWVDKALVRQWQQGRIPDLERVTRSNLSQISEAMSLFRKWATAQGLVPSETAYVAHTPRRQRLQFSRSGDAGVERNYRTHWVSPALREKKLARLAATASQPPERVAVVPLEDGWACHRCKGSGSMLMMEDGRPACLDCAGLGDLEFLPGADTLLARRAEAAGGRSIVVVRFNKWRNRYARQGLLVEPQVLADARRAPEAEPE